MNKANRNLLSYNITQLYSSSIVGGCNQSFRAMSLRQKNYSQIMHKMGDATHSLHIETQRWCSFGLQIRIIDMNKTMTLGDKISKLRKDNNYTQEQLAGILGVSRQSVSKWEGNLAYPETDKLIRMSEMFQCSLDYLLKNDEEMASEQQTDLGLPFFRKRLQERKSEKTVMGMPLWHIARNAKGFVAVGLNARGVIAIGLKAQGVVSLGMLSIGVFSFGMLSIGLLAIGLFALGVLSAGCFALGILTAGAISLGVPAYFAWAKELIKLFL